MGNLICIRSGYGRNHVTPKDCLALSSLDKKINRRHIKIFFLFFPRKQDLTVHANCLQSHDLSNLFSGKNITDLSSAEFAKRVVKVKETRYFQRRQSLLERDLCVKERIILTFRGDPSSG